jgi:hypothetical protein
MSMTTQTGSNGSDSTREPRQLCCRSFWCGQDRVHALNLSIGGMCLRIDRRVEPGEVVELHHGPQLKVKARVAWVRRLENCTEFGVQFQDSVDRVTEWTVYFKPKKEEQILALPAPGQTTTRFMTPPHLTITHNQVNSNASALKPRSWQTAFRIINE